MLFISRRQAAVATLMLSLLGCGGKTAEPPAAAASPVMGSAEEHVAQFAVYKDPQCGCCSDWVAHMRDNGFVLQVNDSNQLAEIKQHYAVAPRYQSCHTAVSRVDGYVFEGHVPARLIARFLAERPAGAIGLAVPGMPVGSPGMEMGDRFDAYDVLLLQADGTASVYEHISAR